MLWWDKYNHQFVQYFDDIDFCFDKPSRYAFDAKALALAPALPLKTANLSTTLDHSTSTNEQKRMNLQLLEEEKQKEVFVNQTKFNEAMKNENPALFVKVESQSKLKTEYSAETMDEGKRKVGKHQGTEIETEIEVLELKCIEDGCNVRVRNWHELHNHQRRDHNLLPYQCFAPRCGKRFNKADLSKHVLDCHSNISSWSCPHCNSSRVLISHAVLSKHLRQFHTEGKYKCGFAACSFIAPYSSLISSHQLSTHLKKKYRCVFTGCGKSYRLKGSLAQHQQTHLAGKLNFHCNWPGCDFVTSHRYNAIRHVRLVHFKLPRSVAKQFAEGIVDGRDPLHYVKEVLFKPIN